MNLQQVVAEAVQLNDSDLERLILHLREVRSRRQCKITETLMPGAKVHFIGRYGQVLNGTVEKVNGKSVKVHVDKPVGNWRVHPSFIKMGWAE